MGGRVGGWLDGWVGVEFEVNANSAPNLVEVEAGTELGKNLMFIRVRCHKTLNGAILDEMNSTISMSFP